MGWLAKSLNRQQNLSPFGEGVAEFFGAIQKKRDKKAFIESVKAGMQTIKDAYTPINIAENTDTGFFPRAGVTPFNPGNVKTTPKQVDYDKANKISSEVMLDFMTKAMDGNLDLDKIEKGLAILEQQRKTLQPQKDEVDIKQFDPTKDVWKLNKTKGTSEVIQKGTPKTALGKKLAEYVDDKNQKHIVIQNPDGSTDDKVVSTSKVRKNEGTKVTIEKPNTWEEIGDLLANVEYKENDKGDIVERTPEEKESVLKVIRKKSMGRLTPKAKNWYKLSIQDQDLEDIATEDFEKFFTTSSKKWKFDKYDIKSLQEYNQYRPDLWDKKLRSPALK